jgi:hypothetical protein
LQGENLQYAVEFNKLRSVATTDDNFQKDVVNEAFGKGKNSYPVNMSTVGRPNFGGKKL